MKLFLASWISFSMETQKTRPRKTKTRHRRWLCSEAFAWPPVLLRACEAAWLDGLTDRVEEHGSCCRASNRFYLPAYIGPMGWIALRLDRDEMDWEEVEALIVAANRRIAPKRLAASVRVPD
jgi:hypothetical protein